MPKPDGRLVLALLAAGALSFLVGFAFTWLSGRPLPGGRACLQYRRGDRRLWRGHLVDPGSAHFRSHAVHLAQPARAGGRRGGAARATVAFFLISQIEHALYVGFEPDRQLRTFLVTFLPPALTVLVQYLILGSLGRAPAWI